MQYCYNCHHLTPGEPLFCNSCGRSYDVKLCPRLHPNPRSAQVCSQCASEDLSTPQPRAPWWLSPLLWLMELVPGIVLLVGSLFLLGSFVQVVLSDQRLLADVLGQMVILTLLLAVLWWTYMQIPGFLRTAFRRGWRWIRKEKRRPR